MAIVIFPRSRKGHSLNQPIWLIDLSSLLRRDKAGGKLGDYCIGQARNNLISRDCGIEQNARFGLCFHPFAEFEIKLDLATSPVKDYLFNSGRIWSEITSQMPDNITSRSAPGFPLITGALAPQVFDLRT